MTPKRDSLRWLRQEVEKWRRDALVDDATAARILQRYPQPPPEQSTFNLLVRILATVGGLLIGLGFILIFAYNWDTLPRPAKLSLAFAPLAICLALAAYTLKTRPNSLAWRESVGLALAFSIAACLGLVAQTLHLPANLSRFYFVWQLCAFPFLFALNARSLFGLLAFLTICWTTTTDNHDLASLAPRFLLATSLLLLFLLLERRRHPSKYTLLAFASATTWSFTAVATLCVPWAPSFLWLALALALFFTLESPGDAFSNRQYPTAALSKLGLTIVAFILTFQDAWEFNSYLRQQTITALVSIVLVSLAYLVILIKWIQAGNRLQLPWAALPLVILLFLGLASLDLVSIPTAALLFTPFTGILGIIAIYDGYQSDSISRLNHGLIIILILATLRFFDSDLGMLPRGIGFILIGVMFLFVNFHFLKRRKEAQDA